MLSDALYLQSSDKMGLAEMFAGGIADKLGNRYEAKWLVRQLLAVIGGNAQSLRYEGISTDFRGFEFAIRRHGITEWHQTKISNPHGNWTLSALKREGVLLAFKNRLDGDESSYCVFVSQDTARDIGTLAEKSKIATSSGQYLESLGDGHTEKFNELVDIWGVNSDKAFSWLRRCDFRTESATSIEAALTAFSDLYFVKASNTAFEILRDFLETRFNQDITTESVRSWFRSECKLTFKDWSLDLTLRERLADETAAYLGTYIPFGVGGSTISRSEACRLVDLVGNPAGPDVVLLTGVAGSGKSGVIREFIGQLDELGIPHLAFRIDQHLDCTSPTMLGKAVTGREESPVSTLKGLGPEGTSVLIVDQVDAVSEVSGRNGIVKQTVLRLLDQVRNFGSIKLIIACRTFDLESDERLKGLKDARGVAHVDLALLEWTSDVEPLLVSKSIDVARFSEKQRGLLCLPLNLALFLETCDHAEPWFASRNDLFARLLEKKGRSIRADRQITWELIAPLSKLAEWMSAQQKLDAPEDILADFGGALDILTSEGLIVRSRKQINFFHESFFDYMYARTFASRQQSLESLLVSSEQHLFRRTQARQILETLRQIDVSRYLRELYAVLASDSVRYHVKVAIAQWLGSLSDPFNEEKNIILALSTKPEAGPFPPLLRYAFFSGAGWFDLLLQDGWISKVLSGKELERTETTFWWLGTVAGQRPAEIASLLDNWWGGDSDRGRKLVEWFGFAKREKADVALTNLCSRAIRSGAGDLFGTNRSNSRLMLLHTWAGANSAGAAEILKAYFEAWFEVHPDQHPFGTDEFLRLDSHSLGEMAKKSPKAFVEGTMEGFVRSIDLIVQNEDNGGRDYSFSHRTYSGHHFRGDAFLNMFRSALSDIATKDADLARDVLARIDPAKHEVFTHIWLETIASNGGALWDLFPRVLESPYVFDAGWDGADWKSLAHAAKHVLPYLNEEESDRLAQRILKHAPELDGAIKLAKQIARDGEGALWSTRLGVMYRLNASGHVQWCILEHIGDARLGRSAERQLAQLRRKFPKSKIPEPHHNEAHFVRSPIQRTEAVRMTDRHWLRAIERYNNEEDRRRERTFTDGGASQLAIELQQLAKSQPARFARLLEGIPDAAPHTYISHILWGLAEADDLDDDSVRCAVLNAHDRPRRPYGSDIARLFGKYPQIASDPDIFEILIWYVENGEAAERDDIESNSIAREVVTIDDLIRDADGLHIRGINGVRGWACEALGNVLWNAPQAVDRAWSVLEQRIAKEHLISVRCCLIRPTVPLYNQDRERCADLVERLARAPADITTRSGSTLPEKIWMLAAFPVETRSAILKRASIWVAEVIERCVRRQKPNINEAARLKWWSPLLTQQGLYLLTFLLPSLPAVGKRLIYRLIVGGDENSRMTGAWHVFRLSFHDPVYAPLAKAFSQNGVVYRRLAADVASHAVTHFEYRHLAEGVLRVSFDDEDKQVRSQAADVFRNIKPEEFQQYRTLADQYVNSRAFEAESFAFFHALQAAECRVDDIVISATEKLITDLEVNGNQGGRRATDLHQLQEIIKREYASSENEPGLRHRLLNLIDKMLSFELYGTDEIIRAHER
jgi:hypothetical protein